MEDLITVIIILLIAFVSIIRKIGAKQPKKQVSGSSAPAGWMGKINAFINEIQQRIDEQQAREDPPSADEWRQLMEEDASDRRYGEAMDDLIPEDEYDLSDEPEARPSRRRPESAPMTLSKQPSEPEMKPGQAEGALPTPALGRSLRPSDLRNAVIWSEILGPPVGLREPGGNRPV